MKPSIFDNESPYDRVDYDADNSAILGAWIVISLFAIVAVAAVFTYILW